MREFGIGQSVPRTEDWRLLRGRGRYTDDINLPNQARLHVLRSPHAAARIRSIDTRAALAAPGVLAVLTGADALADGLGSFASSVRKNRRDGRPNLEPPYRPLAHERARFVGDPVAAVIAETVAQAKDAAELIEIDYEPLPAVTATHAAALPGAPAVWDEQPDNVCFAAETGNRAAVNAAFAAAARISAVDLVISRVAAVPLEPRMAIGAWDPSEERYTLHIGSQSPHRSRAEIAGVLGVAENRVRVISPDVGGGFGLKGAVHAEGALVCWAARRVGRPVKWTGERGESFLSDHQARDNLAHVELALDGGGRFLALRARTTVNLGAYLAGSGIHCAVNNLGGLSGVYTTPAIHVETIGVFTNTNPTAAYRGAGRPEASYMIERVIDTAAADLALDPAELRRRNLIQSTAMPYKTGFVYTYDSGEFARNQDEALRMSSWSEFAGRREAARQRGRLRGLGIAHVIENAGGLRDEMAELRFDPSGTATLLVGTHNHGQGQETTFRQLAHELLGLDPAKVEVKFADTDVVAFGRGSFGSRAITVVGVALGSVAEKIVARGKKLSAHLLEAAEADIEFSNGKFAIAGTDRSLSLEDVARASHLVQKLPPGMEAGLAERSITVSQGPTFPNGCHVCEVEIDPETGSVAIVGYWVVEDVGRVVNPMIVKGQVHGGVAQGAGQALFEAVVHDPETGQPLTGSFMDYRMPRAADFPYFDVYGSEVLAKTNPLGIKGAGEGGTVGAIPAVMNAVCDALRPLGIRSFDMPATPLRVWQAIAAARKDSNPA